MGKLWNLFGLFSLYVFGLGIVAGFIWMGYRFLALIAVDLGLGWGKLGLSILGLAVFIVMVAAASDYIDRDMQKDNTNEGETQNEQP